MAHRKLAILRRRLFTALSVLSLLLCVATLALWVRSYWRHDTLYYLHSDNDAQVSFVTNPRGCMAFGVRSRDTPPIAGWNYDSEPSNSIRGPGTNFRSFLGFGTINSDGPELVLRAFWLPHWFLALLFAVLPALHLRAIIRSRRRRRAGHCPRCGYDLRATPERCPECGTERVLATDEHR